MAHEVETVEVTRYRVDGIEYKNLEDAMRRVEALNKQDELNALHHAANALSAWFKQEVRKAGLSCNAYGYSQFILQNSDKLVERLGYEVIEVD